jgi:hypothetical protein
MHGRLAAPTQHPPFCGGPAGGHGPDPLTKEGAHALSNAVRAAWRRAGWDVPATVERVQTNRNGSAYFVVRTPTLINGVPPKESRIK